MKLNENYELYVEKFDHDGRGIGYIDDKIIFIDNTIPGDKVIIKIKKIKKKYCEAIVEKFLEYSKDRINPICSHFNKCGGCDLQNINYENQLLFKENKVKEILTRFANIPNNKIKSIIYTLDNNFYYRNKITFKVQKDIGMYSKNSYNLVPIEKCYLVNKKTNEILNIIKQNINLDNISQIVIRNSEYNKQVMVIFEGNDFDINNLSQINSEVDSLYIKMGNQYKLISGVRALEEKLGNYLFKISPDSFFQVNSRTCIKLYDKILEYGNFKGNEIVLDLYCGTGTIGIYISRFVKKVIGYEINKYAIDDAIVNIKNNLVDNASFVCGSSELSFEKVTDEIDIIIVDPPRSGLNDKTIQGIFNVKPCKVIYVSCDPITLARDLKILQEYYDVIEVTPVDMFPSTKHVECVCLLKLR